MAEAIVVSLFLMVLLVLQYKEQKKVVISTKKSKAKVVLTIGLATGLLFVFWPDILTNQIKLTAFSILILSIGLFKEGLAHNHLVKVGLLSGEYTQYEQIQIETFGKNQSFVTFYKKKNNHFSLLFDCHQSELIAYFSKIDVPIIVGELPEDSKKNRSKKGKMNQGMLKSNG